jgi:F-type H+-transporting ATPase subunit a
MEHGFTWVTFLVGPVPEEQGLIARHIQWVGLFHMLCSTLLLLAFVMMTRAKVLAQGNDILPDDRLTIRNFFEGLMGFIMGLMKDIIGPNYRKFVPVVLGVWFYILFANLFGLVPYFAPGTDKWSITISMALVVFFATHIYGIQASGIKYFTHFLSPVWPPNIIFIIMMPIYFVIEVIGHLARVASLSIRLMANMMADHTVVAIFLMLTAPLVPAIFTGLGIIVCFMQAFIFSILTTIYFALATAHGGHDEEHGEKHGHAAHGPEPAPAH